MIGVIIVGLMFREAFEKRIGHADNASFVEVAEAFLTEVEEGDEYIVPLNLSRGDDNSELMLIEVGPNEVAACVVSDLEYIKDFEGQAYTIMKARDFMIFVKKNEFLKGIIINPFSRYHCFLPRKEIFLCLEQNGIEI